MSEFFQTNQGSEKVVYQEAGKRPFTGFEHGRLEDMAAGMPRFGVEPIIITLEPNADSGKRPIVHTGREFVYCLDGHIAYTVEEHRCSALTR
ncbi:MAG: cupin domain-containing protein, partial [Chloroflexota bacterium]